MLLFYIFHPLYAIAVKKTLTDGHFSSPMRHRFFHPLHAIIFNFFSPLYGAILRRTVPPVGNMQYMTIF
jgi:hypothetical protein